MNTPSPYYPVLDPDGASSSVPDYTQQLSGLHTLNVPIMHFGQFNGGNFGFDQTTTQQHEFQNSPFQAGGLNFSTVKIYSLIIFYIYNLY